MSRSNSAGSPEAVELTNPEANMLAREIASERLTARLTRHYEDHLASHPAAGRPSYDDSQVRAAWPDMLRQALLEVECGRNQALLDHLRGECAGAIATLFKLPASPSA